MDSRVVVLCWLVLGACGAGTSTAEPQMTATSGPRLGAEWPAIPLATLGSAIELMIEQAAEPPELRGPNGDARAWAEQVYLPWSDDRSARLAESSRARRALRGRPVGARAIGAALHAHLLDETARSLMGVDLEGGLRDEVIRPVEGMRTRAIGAYEVCHELALSAGPAFDGWRVRCGRRMSALASQRR